MYKMVNTKTVKITSPKKTKSTKNIGSPKRLVSPKVGKSISMSKTRGSPKKLVKKQKIATAITRRFIKKSDLRKMILYVGHRDKLEVRISATAYDPMYKAIGRLVEEIMYRVKTESKDVVTYDEKVFRHSFPEWTHKDTSEHLKEAAIKNYISEHLPKKVEGHNVRVTNEFRALVRSLVFHKINQFITSLVDIVSHARKRLTLKEGDVVLLNRILSNWSCV